jgi:hypothetical protein
MPKANRKGVNFFINKTLRGEHQVRKGNKIISRHSSQEEAISALRAARGF